MVGVLMRVGQGKARTKLVGHQVSEGGTAGQKVLESGEKYRFQAKS